MEDSKKILDRLAQEEGEVVNKKNYVVLENDNATTAVKTAAKKINEHPYGDGGPVPGDSVSKYMDNAKNITKDSAINNMINQAALYKAQKESEEAKKSEQSKPLTKKEKEAQRKEIIEYMLHQQEEAYFIQNHYIMDSRTKRRMKAIITHNYDKGMYRPRKNAVNLNE